MNKQQEQTRKRERQGKQELNGSEKGGKTKMLRTKDPPATVATKPATTPTEGKILYARGEDWDGFARFYNQVEPHVSLPEVEAKGGVYVLPLQFVPGESTMFGEKPGKGGAEPQIKFLGGYNVRGELPTGWLPLSQTPAWFQTALVDRRKLIEALGGDLTPWTEGLAGQLIRGQLKKPLRIAFLIFRHTFPNGPTIQAPLGVTLIPQDGDIKIERVFDPQGKYKVEEGEILPQAMFGQTRPDPLIHILWTWAKMENSCRRVRENHRPQPQPTK